MLLLPPDAPIVRDVPVSPGCALSPCPPCLTCGCGWAPPAAAPAEAAAAPAACEPGPARPAPARAARLGSRRTREDPWPGPAAPGGRPAASRGAAERTEPVSARRARPRAPPRAAPPHRVGGSGQRRAVQALPRRWAHAHRPARRSRAQRGPGRGPGAAAARRPRLEPGPRRHLVSHKGSGTGSGPARRAERRGGAAPARRRGAPWRRGGTSGGDGDWGCGKGVGDLDGWDWGAGWSQTLGRVRGISPRSSAMITAPVPWCWSLPCSGMCSEGGGCAFPGDGGL